MRVLYLAQRVPFPPNRGDKIRTFHLIRHLARGHDVYVACLADGAGDLDNVRGIARLVRRVEAVPVLRWKARLRALAALATREPLTRAYFREPELGRRVREIVRSHGIELIIASSSSMAQFVEEFSGVPRVMEFTDLDSMKWRIYAEHVSPPKRWVYALEAERLRRYERRIACAFSHSLLCTRREVDDFRRAVPGASVSVVGNGVDLAYFRPTGGPKAADSLVFTGVLNYFPNADGIVWFGREVLPQVREQVPGVSLTVCGAHPTAAVKALGRIPGVTVTGSVPDVRPYLANAAVAVASLRIARGIQNKVLEAMAMGLPVVATEAAYEGVEAERDRDLLVADGPERFAAQVVRLLRDVALRDRLGVAARQAVERNYTWDHAYAQFDAALAAIAGVRA